MNRSATEGGSMQISMKRRALLASVLMTGLTPRFAIAQAPRDNAKIWPYLASLSGPERKEVLEREARKDGSLVIYGATGLDRGQFWVREFNKRYPDIKADFVRLTAQDIVQRVAAEARSN